MTPFFTKQATYLFTILQFKILQFYVAQFEQLFYAHNALNRNIVATHKKPKIENINCKLYFHMK